MTDSVFFGSIKIAASRFRLVVPVGQDRLANGQTIPHLLGASYWTGQADLPPAYHADAAAAEVALARLERPGETFLVYDSRYDGPRLDPGGALLAAENSEPEIHTLNSDNRRMRVSGLPADYVLSAGDYIGWSYGSNPVRHALHRVETDAVADGNGLTPLFAVEPFIRPGAVTGAAVTLVRPVCKARLISANYGAGRPLITAGNGFEWEQTLR